MLNKLFNKKKKQINKSKQKTSIKKINSRKAIINNLKSSDKKELSVSIPLIKISKPKVKNIDIIMISVDIYYIAYYLKKAQMFIILIKNIQYQAKKKVKAETNLKNVVFQKYYNFFYVFSKKNSDTLFLY